MNTVQASDNPAQSLLQSLNVGRKAASSTDASENRFLTLLTAQLRNQDPMNPMDNAQMTSQLAQISTVGGIERLNATLQAMGASLQSEQSMQAASLLGHSVLVPGNRLSLPEGGLASGALELAGPADQVKVLIKDGNGIVVQTKDLGPQSSGIHRFEWDGITAGGGVAMAGDYRISIEASRGDAKVDATALAEEVIDGVVRKANDTYVRLKTGGDSTLADIRQIM